MEAEREGLRSELEAITADLDLLKNSDKVAFEAIESLGTDDFFGIREQYAAFIRKFPDGSYRKRAEDEIARIDGIIKEAEEEAAKIVKQAEKQPDALASLAFLEAHEFPWEIDAIEVAKEKYRPLADRIRAERQAREVAGVEIENMRATFTVRGESEKLWLPSLLFDVRNIGSKPISRLEISAQFVDNKKRALMGDKVTDHVIGRMSSDSLPPGMAKPVFLYGGVGYTSDWVFVTGGGPDISASVEVSRDGAAPVKLSTFKLKKPPGYER